MLIAATLLAVIFMKKEDDWVYPLVFVWAFIGIGVKNQLNNVPMVVNSAFVLSVFLLVTGMFFVRRKAR